MELGLGGHGSCHHPLGLLVVGQQLPEGVCRILSQ